MKRARKSDQRRSFCAWPSAVAAGGLLLLSATSVLAEFEIQESTIDPGEIQLQYRGAWHGGLPKSDDGDAGELLPDDEEAPLRQSQEAELQMSVTSHWLLALTGGFEQADDDTLKLTAIEFESQIEFVTREGDGLGLAVQAGVEQAQFGASEGEEGDYHFGPIVELAKSKFVLVLNPLFYRERGQMVEQESLGFEYGWQARYEATPKLSLAVEMFGDVEGLANTGAFNEQLHSIGPAFYYTFGKEDDGGEAEGAKGNAELTVSLGAQFGLTEQASDAALKVFIGYEFF